MAFQTHSLTLDDSTRCFNAEAISTATTVNGTTIDLGAANAYARFAVVIDWTGLAVTGTDNEVYRFQVQVSDSSGFSNAMVTGERLLGDKDATGYTYDTPVAGRVVLYADNVTQFSSSDANSYIAGRYVRLRCTTTGTTPAITLTAWLVPIQ
jgi:hypothetical protein